MKNFSISCQHNTCIRMYKFHSSCMSVCVLVRHDYYGHLSVCCDHSGFLHVHFLQYVTNRFQGVLITDGYYSYAVFIYLCGSMESGGGVIGWQASTSQYASYYLSGESNSNDVACANSYYSYNTLVFRLDDSKSFPPSISPMYHLFHIIQASK